jgi:glutathione S-transferase
MIGEKTMSDVTLLGFPRSTFVQIVGLVLPYAFRDLEPDMGSPVHLALHPFDRVPILQHGDFTLYETSAIDGPARRLGSAKALTVANASIRSRHSCTAGKSAYIAFASRAKPKA